MFLSLKVYSMVTLFGGASDLLANEICCIIASTFASVAPAAKVITRVPAAFVVMVATVAEAMTILLPAKLTTEFGTMANTSSLLTAPCLATVNVAPEKLSVAVLSKPLNSTSEILASASSSTAVPSPCTTLLSV